MEKANLDKPNPQWSILQVSTVVYGVFAILGALLAFFAHKTLVSSFNLDLPPLTLIKFAATGLLGAGVLLIVSYFFEDWFATYRDVKRSMVQILGPVSIGGAIYLALVSSMGEELLFRAGLQPYLGITLTALLFGLLHIGPAGEVSSWSVWATIAGMLLGWVYQETNSLWPPMITHFAVNCFSILRLRSLYQSSETVTVTESKSDLDRFE